MRQARKFRAEKGILPSPQNYSRNGLSTETKQLINEFYESDEVSSLLLGKKDCVSVKLTDGSKTRAQKRLLLSNLSEIYVHFKEENPNVSVGFSTFATLRPNWYVTVGASGSRSVFVCTYHQNVTLMLSAVNPALGYKYVLSFCVCDIHNQNCMLHHCDDCPSETDVKRFLKEQLLQHYSPDDNIKFKQWVSTARKQLEDKEEFFDDFLEKLSEMLHDLTKHHFVSQKQAKFFKEKKESFQPGECALVLDFAENYSFVVQDAAQGFHRNNSQATIHPFVLYYVDPATRNVCHKSYACISNQMIYDTVTVLFPSKTVK